MIRHDAKKTKTPLRFFFPSSSSSRLFFYGGVLYYIHLSTVHVPYRTVPPRELYSTVRTTNCTYFLVHSSSSENKKQSKRPVGELIG